MPPTPLIQPATSATRAALATLDDIDEWMEPHHIEAERLTAISDQLRSAATFLRDQADRLFAEVHAIDARIDSILNITEPRMTQRERLSAAITDALDRQGVPHHAIVRGPEGRLYRRNAVGQIERATVIDAAGLAVPDDALDLAPPPAAHAATDCGDGYDRLAAAWDGLVIRDSEPLILAVRDGDALEALDAELRREAGAKVNGRHGGLCQCGPCERLWTMP